MELHFLDIIDLLVVYQGLFIFFFLSYKAKDAPHHTLWLGGFVLTISLDYLNTFFFSSKLVLNYPNLAFLFNGMPLLAGPLLYLYVCARTKQMIISWANLALHSIPFSLVTIWSILRFYTLSAQDQLQFLIQPSEAQAWEIRLIVVGGFIQILIYLSLSFKQLFTYRKQLKNYFSSIEKVNLNWLLNLVIGFSVLVLLNLLKNFWEVAVIFEVMYQLVGLTTLAYLNVMLLKILERQELIDFQQLNQQQEGAMVEDLTPIIERVHALLSKERLFTDATLTISKLADQLPYSSRQISTAINKGLGTNFYELINKRRIEEAKTMLIQTGELKKSISEIMFEIGFNSKSSFNTAFKKYTGQTPSAFRRQMGK
ncbi:MAG: helix-turn-helix domain-containing protein [Flammeovirgaceae bacterium]